MGYAVSAVVAGGVGGKTPAITTKGKKLTGVIVPASWVTSNLTFEGSFDGTNFFLMIDSDNATITWTGLVASRFVVARRTVADEIGTPPFIKIISSADQVGAAATRTLQLLFE